MITSIFTFLVLLFVSCGSMSSQASETRTKIAIIDSGMSYAQSSKDYICKDGKPKRGNPQGYNLTNSPYIWDEHGHGTNIISIIAPSINPKTHCIVMFKVWYPKIKGNISINATHKALRIIYNDKSFKYLNMSMGGPEASMTEKRYLKSLLHRGMFITVASGNDELDLDKRCKYFPACYRLDKDMQLYNFRVVTTKFLVSSNRGSVVTDIEHGHKLGKPVLSGTSQATAVKMSKILKSVVYKNRRNNDDGTLTNYRGLKDNGKSKTQGFYIFR